jgi:hypothetical protein
MDWKTLLEDEDGVSLVTAEDQANADSTTETEVISEPSAEVEEQSSTDQITETTPDVETVETPEAEENSPEKE